MANFRLNYWQIFNIPQLISITPLSVYPSVSPPVCLSVWPVSSRVSPLLDTSIYFLYLHQHHLMSVCGMAFIFSCLTSCLFASLFLVWYVSPCVSLLVCIPVWSISLSMSPLLCILPRSVRISTVMNRDTARCPQCITLYANWVLSFTMHWQSCFSHTVVHVVSRRNTEMAALQGKGHLSPCFWAVLIHSSESWWLTYSCCAHLLAILSVTSTAAQIRST